MRCSNRSAIWSIVQGETKRGNKSATVNWTLSTMRALLRMARDEWQWIDNFPKIRMLSGEVERDRWLTRAEAEPIRWQISNTAWHTALAAAGVEDFRFHGLRHTWASWHRQAGTSCDELKDLGGWKSRIMVDRYAKFSTENLLSAASAIERTAEGRNAAHLSRFVHAEESVQAVGQPGPINGLGAVDMLIFCCHDSSKLESMLDDSYWAPGIDAQGSRPVLVQRWHVEHRAQHSSQVFGRRGSAFSAAISSMGGVHAQHYSLSDIGDGRPYRICNECQCATGQYLRLGT